MKIGGESKEGSPDRHLDPPFPFADGCNVRQFADVTVYLLDDIVHLVKHIEEPSIRKVEMCAETVNRDDDPVGVATATPLGCWSRIARLSAFRQCYGTIPETGETRGQATGFRLCRR